VLKVINFYLIPEVLVEVLEGAGEPDVGDVDDAFQADAVPTDRLGHRLQVGADAALNLTKINTVITLTHNNTQLTYINTVITLTHNNTQLTKINTVNTLTHNNMQLT
jgi:hypothetical protein